METKLILSILWTFISLWAFLYYYYSILKWDTKPHIYTWLIFWISLWTAFVIQVNNNAGYGAYVTFMEFAGCLIAVLLALRYWEKNITKFDTLCFTLALLSLVLYLIFKTAVVSTILIILVDILAIIPTYRKSFNKPNEETIIIYIMSFVIYIFAIAWLTSYTFSTYWYPLSIMLADLLLVAFILSRRKQLYNKQ